MQRRWWSFGTVVGFSLSAVVVAGGASAHPIESAGPSTAPPAALSTSGDYATDVLGDPWDFSNPEDVPPIALIGSENSFGISVAGGVLTVDAGPQSTIKLLRTWGSELAWGRDGLAKPADAAVYSHLSFRMNIGQKRNMGVHYWTESGAQNILPFTVTGPGFTTYDIDLTGAGLLGPGAWSGKIIRLEILAGGNDFGGAARFPMELDWARLHRADASVVPVSSPILSVTSPSEEGGADYATVSGDPWDFGAVGDIVSMGDINIRSLEGANLNGTTFANDSFIELPLRTPLNPDRYHRATIEVCYAGGFSFANAPGGGMNARFAWFDEGGQTWSETQDIIIYPGCNRMTIDLATAPAVAVNDENTMYKAGWRGLRISRLRFDVNEDPGVRDFSLNEIRLADDAAFSSGNFPIKFHAETGGTAEIFVTTDAGLFNGTKVGTVQAVAGDNTFAWNGTNLPNGTYWVWIKMTNASGVGSAYSTGPVRIERDVPATRSFYVPLNPVRLLDTRTGVGGNISALSTQALTELDVTGVGGVPETGATAVVLNVTVDAPLTSGFITAWPSGEGQPAVSNLNFVAGQTVPNLVTVKVGANGRVNLYNSEGFTHLVADVVGYYTATQPAGAGRFTAVTPGRVLDTRNGSGPVGAGVSIPVKVTGLADVPAAGVSGVALNVTVDQPTAPGYLTVWPTGELQPFASSHNFVAGQTVANLVLAKVGAGGQVSIFNSGGSTHVIADVVGYFSASGGVFVPMSPQRIVDSRDVGGIDQVGQGVTVPIAVAGVAGVPANATAAIVNVTSVDSTTPSFITVWPAGGQKPTASTVNPRPGVPVPNLAYLKLGSAGQLSLYNNSGSTDVIVDVFGYVVP